MKKNELRRVYLSKRSNLTARAHRIGSNRIADRFLGYFDPGGISFLHHFFPIIKNKEVDCLIIANRIQERNANLRLAAPRINSASGELECVEIGEATRFLVNKWGISEPVGDEFVDEADIDLVLVPLLCFDKSGHRVGYGKGYYDRFLAKCRGDCLKVGLSFYDPVDKIEGIHEKDVRLDFCVSPSKVFEISV